MTTGNLPHAARHPSFVGPGFRALLPWMVPCLSGVAALATIAVQGPVSLASMRLEWAATFLAALIVVLVWWGGYAWLYSKLAPQPRDVAWLLWPLAALLPSLAPDVAVVFSGKLPYAIVFDEATFRTFRYLAAGTIGAAVLLQEGILLRTAGLGRREVFAAGEARPATRRPLAILPRIRAATLPGLAVLVAILLLGAKLRLDVLDAYQGGDMDVLLSITYNMLLGWPPVTYYHNYMPQTWVYNHLPFFPITLAPIYWVFENILQLPTPWAAKLLIGTADVVIAGLLYRQARGRWHGVLGLAFAGLWMLSPWVISSDDHPIAFAIAFALLALVFLERPWLCGLMLALGVASRNEVGFLALPVIVHFAARRPLAQSVAFFAASGTTLAFIAAPYLLYDPAAMDYALRGQLQRDAATVQSMLFSALSPYLNAESITFLRLNPSLPTVILAGITALLALREGRVERVVLLVSLVYLVTLPLMYERYTLFAFALSLFYSARYGNPILAGAAFLIVWPGFPYGSQLMLGLVALICVVALIRPVKRTGATGIGRA